VHAERIGAEARRLQGGAEATPVTPLCQFQVPPPDALKFTAS
jgi:hypothetical protein